VTRLDGADDDAGVAEGRPAVEVVERPQQPGVAAPVGGQPLVPVGVLDGL
jgi:hypothetical protein